MSAEIHICTEDDFFIDAPKFVGQCWICLVECEQTMGWLGCRCSSCGYRYDTDMSMLVRDRREFLGLTRRQIADRLGYKPSSIKAFEWGACSRKYFDATERLVIENRV